MTFASLATFLTAAIGYALMYAAMPNRTALRNAPRASTRRLLVAGAAIVVISAVLGAIAFGPVLGPTVALTGALTVGSALILAGPFLTGERGESRAERWAGTRAEGGGERGRESGTESRG
jgi:hypothetical protein